MTPEDIQRKELAGIVATQLEDVRGCGCCSEYTPTPEQNALAQYWGLAPWAVVVADTLLKNGVKL